MYPAGLRKLDQFGHPAEIDGLLAVAHDFNIALVEDAAESLGSTVGGRHTGTFGLLGREALADWLHSAGGRGEALSEEFFLRLLVGREHGADPRAWVEAERARVAGLLRLAGGDSPERERATTGVADLVALWRRLRARADLAALDACLAMLGRS